MGTSRPDQRYHTCVIGALHRETGEWLILFGGVTRPVFVNHGLAAQVRNRAFAVADRPANVEAYVNAISSKADMLKAIQKERLLEFPGEMLRKQDLIRWNLLGTAVRQTVTDMRALRDRTGKYDDAPTKV